MAHERGLRSTFFVLGLIVSLFALIGGEAGEESDDLVWFVQLSDLHISKHHPERAADLKAKVAPALALIQPSLVLITGDLTESRTATRYPTRQDDWEWYEYNTVIASISKASGVPIESIVDIRGNHDTFGVGLRGGPGDFYPKYGAIGGRPNRTAGALQRVFTVDLQAQNGQKHVLVGIDATQDIGLRGPCNFFGTPSDALLDNLDSTLERIHRVPNRTPPPVVAFGHFTLSFMAQSASGRRLEDVLKKHGVSAYLCGHLHARFGGLLHKFHSGGSGLFKRRQLEGADRTAKTDPDEEYEDARDKRTKGQKVLADGKRRGLSETGGKDEGFWEWEMGDWKESRFMRLVAIRKGKVSFSDVQFPSIASEENGHVATTEYQPSVGLVNKGTTHDSQFYDSDSALILVLSPLNGHYQESFGVDAIEMLVFSHNEPLDVSALVWDRGTGFASKGVIKEEVELNQVPGRAVLYRRRWDPAPYPMGQAGRYWIQIVVRDSTGQKLASRQQPFVIGGVKGGRLPLTKQSLASFLLIGVPWDELYAPALVGVYVLLLGLLLILPRSWASYLQSAHKFEDWTLRVISRPLRKGWNPLVFLSRLLEIATWALCQSATRTSVWLPQALDDASAPLASFYLRHWNVALAKNGASVSAPMPCTLILALPFYLLVLFPWMIWIVAFGAYREVVRRPVLKASLSIPPRKDIERQLESHPASESNLLSRSESASNLAQRRRALSKSSLKEREEEEQVSVQSTGLRTGPRLEILGWAVKGVGVLLTCWTVLHSTFAVKAYGGTVLLSPYLLGLLCVVSCTVSSLR